MSVSFKEVYRLSLQLSPEERRRLAEFLTNPPLPPTAQQIISTLEQHLHELRKMGVERIGLFGSYARDEADPASDIDILVRLSQPSFRTFMGVKFYLEELLEHPVDLVLEDSLRDELRLTVLGEVRYVQGL